MDKNGNQLIKDKLKKVRTYQNIRTYIVQSHVLTQQKYTVRCKPPLTNQFLITLRNKLTVGYLHP